MGNNVNIPNGNTGAADIKALIPQPHIFKIGGAELRLQALPVRRLLAVVQYVQDNADLMDKLAMIDQPSGEGGGVNVVGFLETEVYRRLNGLTRLLFDKATGELLTDDWCAEHMSNAHYAAIFRVAIQQNQLDWIFQRAGEFLAQKLDAALRQAAYQGRTTVPTAQTAETV